jgi:hypothetical protein
MPGRSGKSSSPSSPPSPFDLGPAASASDRDPFDQSLPGDDGTGSASAAPPEAASGLWSATRHRALSTGLTSAASSPAHCAIPLDEPVHVRSPVGIGIPGLLPIPECPTPQEDHHAVCRARRVSSSSPLGRAAPMMPVPDRGCRASAVGRQTAVRVSFSDPAESSTIKGSEIECRNASVAFRHPPQSW